MLTKRFTSASLLLVSLIAFGGTAYAGPQLNQQQPMPTPKTVALAKAMTSAPASRPVTQPMVAARQEVLTKEQQIKTYVAAQNNSAGLNRNVYANPAAAAQNHFDSARASRQLGRFYVKMGDRPSAAAAFRDAASSYRNGASQLQANATRQGAIVGAPDQAKAHNAEIAAAHFDAKATALAKPAAPAAK